MSPGAGSGPAATLSDEPPEAVGVEMNGRIKKNKPSKPGSGSQGEPTNRIETNGQPVDGKSRGSEGALLRPGLSVGKTSRVPDKIKSCFLQHTSGSGAIHLPDCDRQGGQGGRTPVAGPGSEGCTAHLVLALSGGPGAPVPPSRGLVSRTLISYSVSGSRWPILCVVLSTGCRSYIVPDTVRYSTSRSMIGPSPLMELAFSWIQSSGALERAPNREPCWPEMGDGVQMTVAAPTQGSCANEDVFVKMMEYLAEDLYPASCSH
ncbi:hypothetical protein EYF80_001225 [Liparis tanakae]|uniref:Uncharacterized protein n=1 Tax=Liparis tanakae TaxID=230148 RepID=A0A4Z2JF82_9TELE|nr:hypothetical protein EYF80_001225 [Liparis tanakae]